MGKFVSSSVRVMMVSPPRFMYRECAWNGIHGWRTTSTRDDRADPSACCPVFLQAEGATDAWDRYQAKTVPSTGSRLTTSTVRMLPLRRSRGTALNALCSWRGTSVTLVGSGPAGGVGVIFYRFMLRSCPRSGAATLATRIPLPSTSDGSL